MKFDRDDNKIRIPWYKRNVRIGDSSFMGIPPLSINFPKGIPIQPKAQPRTQPQTQPETQPETQPATQPTTNPVTFPNPVNVPNPLNPFPFPFPLPERNNNPNPNPDTNPAPQGGTGGLNPAPSFATPAPAKESAFSEMFGKILKPVLYLFVANEIKNQWIEANVTEPVYNAMLQDPVLGLALREVEKANLDMETAVNYFANYDYANFDLDQMTLELTALFGAAAAARIIVFFIGRKVLFKI